MFLLPITHFLWSYLVCEFYFGFFSCLSVSNPFLWLKWFRLWLLFLMFLLPITHFLWNHLICEFYFGFFLSLNGKPLFFDRNYFVWEFYFGCFSCLSPIFFEIIWFVSSSVSSCLSMANPFSLIEMISFESSVLVSSPAFQCFNPFSLKLFGLWVLFRFPFLPFSVLTLFYDYNDFVCDFVSISVSLPWGTQQRQGGARTQSIKQK